jgi:hypothetical protein
LHFNRNAPVRTLQVASVENCDHLGDRRPMTTVPTNRTIVRPERTPDAE